MEALLADHFSEVVSKTELTGGARVEVRRSPVRERHVMYYRTEKVTPSYVEEYVVQHKKFMQESPVSKHRNLVFIYDLRRSEYAEFQEAFMPFVKVHQDLRDTYATRLIGTIIVIDNELIGNVINFVLANVYKPTRPLRMVMERDAVAEMSAMGIIKDAPRTAAGEPTYASRVAVSESRAR